MPKTLRIVLTLLAVLALAFAGAGCTAKAKKAYHLSRADHYYRAGQLPAAEIEYLNALRFDHDNALANSRLGLIYYDQGRLQRAAFFLGRATQFSPDNLEVRLKLGFIYSSVGQFSNALVQANYVLEKKPLDDEAPILLAEASALPKTAAAARQRLQAMARAGDRAPIEVALGNLALRDHDVATAEAALKKAQTLDPKSPAVNAGLAAVAWARDDVKQADACFKAAADASSVRSPRRMQYIRFKIQTGDLAGAQALLADIIKAAPDYIPASMVSAQIAATEKKFDESAKLLDQVLALDEDNFDALLFRGQLDLARSQAGQAVTDLERMARLYPQVPQVQYQLGSAYLAANDTTKAAACFNRTLELNPNYIEATLLLAEIQIKTGNADPAIASLEHLRKQQPRLAQAQLLLADAYRLRNRATDALALYRNLESLYPTNAQIPLLHGAALVQLKDDAGARQEFERALELSPGNLPATEQLVDLDLSETNFDAATQLINRDLQAYPKQVTFRLLAGKIQLAQGRRDQAESTLQQALELDPENQGTYLLLAQLDSDTGQNQKALARLNEAMARNPDNPSALMLAAKIHTDNKDYQGAADAYEKLLKIDPKYSPALNNLAYLYSENLNNLDRAYELAQHARELLPFDPATADTLGWISCKRGAYDTALGLLKESGAKLPQPEVQFHLGLAAYMTGDETTARAALQRAGQPGTDFPGRAESQLCLSILEINPATADAAARARLEKRVADKPNDPVALVRLARIYQRDGSADQAATAYEAMLKAKPSSLDAMTNLISLYAPKDLKKAYDLAKTASKLAPYDPSVSHLLGRLAFQSGDYNLAASMLQQALQNQPNDPALLFDYARATYSIGRVSDAQSALQGALAAALPAPQADQARRMLDLINLAAAPAPAAQAGARLGEILRAEPDNVPALMARAAASQAAGDDAAAAQLCEKALALYPDFTPAQSQLAQLYAADPAKLDRAYALAVKVHDALPDDPAAAKTLGIVLVQRGDYAHAISTLKQSAFKLNSDPVVFYYLGSAQFHLKNRAESKASLQQALDLKLPGKLADSARQMLAQLK
jgi:tetratricopeptide (TPR) repeat protein